MNAVTAPQVVPIQIGPTQRVRMTLLFSVMMHVVVVLGVGFSYEDPASSLPTLDVILVDSATQEKPEKADFLANATQIGGGDSKQKKRPSSSSSSPVPKPTPGISPTEQRASSPPPQPIRPLAVVKTEQPSSHQVKQAPETPEAPDLKLSGREIIERNMEMAKLAASVSSQLQANATRPKRKYITANTQEYADAAYMRAWVTRIERIGNLNYPDEARSKRVSGNLILSVAIRRNGSVEKIDIIQSSGFNILDEAAIRIVRLAEPFDPLPKTDDADIAQITRTWQFLPDGTFRNENVSNLTN